MKYYKCDHCKKEKTVMAVELKGVKGSNEGAILLPDRDQERHFCNPDCFWFWALENNPFYNPIYKDIGRLSKKV